MFMMFAFQADVFPGCERISENNHFVDENDVFRDSTSQLLA